MTEYTILSILGVIYISEWEEREKYPCTLLFASACENSNPMTVKHLQRALPDKTNSPNPDTPLPNVKRDVSDNADKGLPFSHSPKLKSPAKRRPLKTGTKTAMQVNAKHPTEITEHEHDITNPEISDYLEALSTGLTQDQAAAVVGRDSSTIRSYIKKHREVHSSVERAMVQCIQSRIKAQTRIGDERDPKALSAAVKANACLLAAYDDRFRHQRDGGPGTGAAIQVVVNVPAPTVAGFLAAGGSVQPEALKVLVDKYGPGIVDGETDGAKVLARKDLGPTPEGPGGHGPTPAPLPHQSPSQFSDTDTDSEVSDEQ